MFKAVIFDIGQTLVDYRKPMNWSELYRPAFEHIAEKYGYTFSESHYQNAGNVLAQYNTRIHPRDHEVSSTEIFTEILNGMNIALQDMERVKESFYTYFRQDCSLFPDVEQTLKALSVEGIRSGTLSDVAYGMDNVYALEDIAPVIKYIEYPFTSNDTGYRKSCTKGLEILSDRMQVKLSDIVFVGDEEKDMACARNAGAYAVLINREGVLKDYGSAKVYRKYRHVMVSFCGREYKESPVQAGRFCLPPAAAAGAESADDLGFQRHFGKDAVQIFHYYIVVFHFVAVNRDPCVLTYADSIYIFSLGGAVSRIRGDGQSPPGRFSICQFSCDCPGQGRNRHGAVCRGDRGAVGSAENPAQGCFVDTDRGVPPCQRRLYFHPHGGAQVTFQISRELCGHSGMLGRVQDACQGQYLQQRAVICFWGSGKQFFFLQGIPCFAVP